MKNDRRHKKGVVLMIKVAGLLGIACLLAAAGPIGPVLAATWHVATDGTDINSGADWSDAFATIQRGIDASAPGDTILVADGTYTGAGNKHIRFDFKAIEVRSVNGPHHCIIDLENDGKGFHLQWTPAGSIVDGFTIMNGLPESPTDYGVGIQCDGCYTSIRNCIIKNHSGVQWGAGIDVRNNSAPVIVNTIFTGNQATVGGSAASFYKASATFINCTVVGNSGGSSVATPTQTTSFTNCIFWNNVSGDISGDPSVTFSTVQVAPGVYPEDVYPGEGNINTAPRFVDYEDKNFRLAADSDCIDSGSNSATGTAIHDLDRKPRFIDGDGDLSATVDMGAYEYGDICQCDFNGDLYTDGADLADFARDSGGMTLSLLAEDYGRIDCPTYAFIP